jgi:hypothetical protein
MQTLFLLAALLPADARVEKNVVEPAAVIKDTLTCRLGCLEVESKVSIGSGVQVSIDNKTYVLTAAHVLTGHYKAYKDRSGDEEALVRQRRDVTVVTALGGKETERVCKVVHFDRKRDVALLEPVCAKGMTPVTLDRRLKVGPGDTVYFCGAGVIDWNLVKTYVSRTLPKKGLVAFATSAGWFGHSGSGLFAESSCCGGRTFTLVGLVHAAFCKGEYRLALAVDRDTIDKSLAAFKALRELEDE